jgi:hypothetical protein
MISRRARFGVEGAAGIDREPALVEPVFERYRVDGMGATVWNMVYFERKNSTRPANLEENMDRRRLSGRMLRGVVAMSLAPSVLEHTLLYRAWQVPFAGQKFAPMLTHSPLQRVRRVLDVACGPGTNTKYFVGADYLGIDFDLHYIQEARWRHGRNFVVADVRNNVAAPEDGSISFW